MKIDVFKRKKQQFTIFAVMFIVITFYAVRLTQFDFVHGIYSIPKAISWMVENLIISKDAWSRFPSILDKLIETIFLSIASTVTASITALFLAILGSQTTKINSFFSMLSRSIASIFRNIPVVAWALILLLSFGQNTLTGYLALYFATLGFLTRAFTETIDETSQSSVEALQATGATYLQIVQKAVLPECAPQMMSWILFMIETNIRSSTLIGILTGTGIGFAFDLYYKNMNYSVVSLITLSIVAVVLLIELLSNYVRRAIL